MRPLRRRRERTALSAKHGNALIANDRARRALATSTPHEQGNYFSTLYRFQNANAGPRGDRRLLLPPSDYFFGFGQVFQPPMQCAATSAACSRCIVPVYTGFITASGLKSTLPSRRVTSWP